MKRKKLPDLPYKLVMIEWEDSARPIGAWIWVDEYSIPETVKCISVGFIVAETDKAIALAPNLGDVELDRAQAAGVIRLPKSAVLRTIDL